MSSRARFWRWTALLLGAAVLLMVAFVPIPFLTRAPGPVFDVLGDHDGEPVLQITGAKQYPTTGALFMTTVAQAGGGSGVVTVGAGVLAFIDPNTSVEPDPLEQVDDTELQRAVFDSSGSQAVGAAADYLGRPVTTQPVVLTVLPGTPADGRLEAGDLIDSVGGKALTTFEQFGRIIRRAPIGTSFALEVTRGKRDLAVTVTSRQSEQDPERPAIGITGDTHYASDFEASVSLTQIGGPSAGLVLALAMVDKLTPDDLLAGNDVAGTGAIGGTGEVGPIGGIDKKMIAARDVGARLFVAPEGNCAELTRVPEGLEVVPVATLRDTVEAVRDWRAGRPLATCPAAAGQDNNG